MMNLKATEILEAIDAGRFEIMSELPNADEYRETYVQFQLPYIHQFIQRAQRFFVGTVDDIPDTDVDVTSLHLPFPETYVEISPNEDEIEKAGVNGRYVFLCTEHASHVFKPFEEAGYKYLFAVRPMTITYKRPNPALLNDSAYCFVVAINPEDPEAPEIMSFKLGAEIVDTEKKAKAMVEVMNKEKVPHDIYRSMIFKVFSFLNILSCSNITTETILPPPRLNKRRIEKHQHPFFKYHTLVLNKQYNTRSDNQTVLIGERKAPCFHWRRGHIRKLHNTEKKVWVSPCLVGTPEQGLMVKEYKVKGK